MNKLKIRKNHGLRDPRFDTSSKDNLLRESTKNEMVWARDEKVKLGVP